MLQQLRAYINAIQKHTKAYKIQKHIKYKNICNI